MRIQSRIEFHQPNTTTAPDAVEKLRGQRKLREEFPFLGFPSCPVELKALVADRITAYHAYREHYPKLFLASTPEECRVVAGKVVEAYIENRRVWEELNHYKQHGRILGHHPIFRHFSNLRKVRAMSLRDLLQRERQVKNNIWRVQSEMKKNPDSSLTQARIDRLRGYQAELAEIRRQLGDD